MFFFFLFFFDLIFVSFSVKTARWDQSMVKWMLSREISEWIPSHLNIYNEFCCEIESKLVSNVYKFRADYLQRASGTERECERGVEVEANKMTLCKIDNIDAMRCEMFQLRRINPLLCLFRSLLLSVRANGDFDVNKSFDTNTNQRMKNKNELQTHIKCNWSELATQMRSVFSCCVCFFYSLVFFFVYYCLQKIKYKQFWRFSINFCTAYIQFIYENWEWWKWK